MARYPSMTGITSVKCIAHAGNRWRIFECIAWHVKRQAMPQDSIAGVMVITEPIIPARRHIHIRYWIAA